jgi:hypothetical protein
MSFLQALHEQVSKGLDVFVGEKTGKGGFDGGGHGINKYKIK